MDKAEEIAEKLSSDFEKLHGMRLGWVTDRFTEALRTYADARLEEVIELIKSWEPFSMPIDSAIRKIRALKSGGKV